MSRYVRVGILGEFHPEYASHRAMGPALEHAAAALDVAVEPEWVSTASLAASAAAEILAGYDAIWASPGSPYATFDGMLRGIEFTRVRDWPFAAT